MDPRRGGIDRSASVYGGAAALRGVKIDIKRGCLDEIRLPESVKNASPFNPRDYAYNFEREKDVIRRAEDRRRSSLAAIADQPDSDVPAATGKPVSAAAANPVSASSLLHGILQPTVLTGTATAASGKSDDDVDARKQKINYAEFEDQSSTPFEDVALQTIDDMGELRQILQPAVETEESSSSTDGRRDVKQPPKPKPRVRSTPNALPVPKPRPRSDNSPKVTRLPPGAKPTAFAAAAAAAATKAAPSQEQPPSYDSLAPPDPSQQADSFDVGGDDLLPPPYEVDASAPTQVAPRPAPRQNHFVSRGPEGLVLPNPYSKLKADQRAFVDRTATMGFPQERVARIVQKVGTEEKDVFDALLLIGKIEDKYPANSAEVALFNNKLNLEKSLESLKVAFELKELGFPEEKIHEALKRHENDREKALDFLLSSA